MSVEQRKRFLAVLLFSMLIGSLAAIIVISKLVFGIGFICPFHAFFGWECPGCGGSRMMVSMLQLKFYQAFRYNVFIFSTLPLLVTIYIWQCIKYIKDNAISVWLDKAMLIYLIGLLIFGLVRNIDRWSWLLPTTV